MQENKEFEEWKKDNTDKCMIGVKNYPYAPFAGGFVDISREAQVIYEAGQKSVKPRWIPVTERLPTEKDGKIHKGSIKNSEYIYLLIKCISRYGLDVLPVVYSLSLNKFIASDTSIIIPHKCVIAWQSLPEV